MQQECPPFAKQNMSNNILWKSFSFCFSKLKCFPTITFPNEEDVQHHKSSHQFNNFNSLYDVNSGTISTSKSLTFTSTADDLFSSLDDYDSESDYVPDFTSAFASHRFFFSSTGNSNSIFEPPEILAPPLGLQDTSTINGGASVAIQTYSPDPFSDFRRSMKEMIEARELSDGKADWEFLQELLLCYITLNPKHTHKFIIGAFADVIVSLALPPAS